jgi:hypothetical protein
MRRHSTHVWLYVGLSLTAIVQGYMVGASDSPVVGSAITAFFGLGVAAVGVFKERRSQSEEKLGAGANVEAHYSPNWIRSAGIMLTIFALSYLTAAVAGSVVRARSTRPERASFPWTEKTQPGSPQKALQWLVVQKRLRDYGYTATQIQSLYQLVYKMNDDTGGSLLDSVPEPAEPTMKRTFHPGDFANQPQIPKPPAD